MIRYEYWPNGLLSRRSSSTSQSHFYPDRHKNIQTVVKDGQWRSLVRHGQGIVGRQIDQGLDQFFKVNESTGAALQQANGKTQLRLHRYDAYGKPLQRNSNADIDFTWNQELNEPETGLTYLRHRFHHPELRRFITRDNVPVDNRYAYAHGDPVNYIDPTGHIAMNAVTRYFGGSLAISLSILGTFLAAPTGGLSLAVGELAAAIIAGFFSLTSFSSGALLIGSQLALDSGNKSAAKALSISSLVFSVFAGADLAVAALAPKLARLTARWISQAVEGGAAIESPAFEMVLIPEAAENIATPGQVSTLPSNVAETSFSEERVGLLSESGNESGSNLMPKLRVDEAQKKAAILGKQVSQHLPGLSKEQQGWVDNFMLQTINSADGSTGKVINLLQTTHPEELFSMQELRNLGKLISEQVDLAGENNVLNGFDRYANNIRYNDT